MCCVVDPPRPFRHRGQGSQGFPDLGDGIIGGAPAVLDEEGLKSLKVRESGLRDADGILQSSVAASEARF
jgi:hypothetical protein